MKRFNEDLDKEFRQLGFDNYKEMLSQAVLFDDMKSFNMKEKLATDGLPGSKRIEFHFVVENNESTRRSHIESIRMDLLKPVDTVEPRLVNRKFYQKSDGPLPTKDVMIQEMSRLEAFRLERIENARKIVESAKRQPPQESREERVKTGFRIRGR